MYKPFITLSMATLQFVRTELSIKLDRKRVYAISVCIKQRWIATYANA